MHLFCSMNIVFTNKFSCTNCAGKQDTLFMKEERKELQKVGCLAAWLADVDWLGFWMADCLADWLGC